jgi:hypothetical protein
METCVVWQILCVQAADKIRLPKFPGYTLNFLHTRTLLHKTDSTLTRFLLQNKYLAGWSPNIKVIKSMVFDRQRGMPSFRDDLARQIFNTPNRRVPSRP